MDAFSLLRYWRSNGGGAAAVNGNDSANNANLTNSTVSTTIVTAVSTQTSDTEEEDDENDHGPFFDLEFSLPEEAKIEETENGVVFEEDDESDDSDGSEEAENVIVSVSPSDDLFFKGGVVPVDKTTSEIDFKPTESQSRVSLMKSATKLRVMMLKFNNKKSNLKNEEKKKLGEIGENDGEQLPIVSLFKRHNSSKIQKKRQNDVESVANDEKKFSKEAMQRYLRKVKPLYVRVSKRYGEKLKFSGQLRQSLAPTATETEKQSPVAKDSNLETSELPLLTSNGNGKGLKQGNLPAGLRVVCKHLGKSRSASTAVVAAAPPGTISSKRRDDSLLQQQDGIQSAILHCKRSFKASRDSDCSSSESVAACGNSLSSETVVEGSNDSQKAGRGF